MGMVLVTTAIFNITHDPHHQKSAEQIRSVIGNHHKPIDHKEKQHDNRHCPKKPQFLADNGKDHIVLRLRKKSQFLDALSQSLAHKSAGADGVESLKNLEALSLRIQLRVQPRLDPAELVWLKEMDI